MIIPIKITTHAVNNLLHAILLKLTSYTSGNAPEVLGELFPSHKQHISPMDNPILGDQEVTTRIYDTVLTYNIICDIAWFQG